MSIDNNFDLWRFATHPLIQEYTSLDEETNSYVRSSHPAVAHLLDAMQEIREAVDLARRSQ
jgi:hypothetical protein